MTIMHQGHAHRPAVEWLSDLQRAKVGKRQGLAKNFHRTAFVRCQPHFRFHVLAARRPNGDKAKNYNPGRHNFRARLPVEGLRGAWAMAQRGPNNAVCP